MIRQALLAASRNLAVRDLLVELPLTHDVVQRFVAGETWEEARSCVRDLVGKGLAVTIDVLGEDTTDEAQAELRVADYCALLDDLAAQGLTGAAEVSIKPSALGLTLDGGDDIARRNAGLIVAKAKAVGTTVTVDMEGYDTTEQTIRLVEALRVDTPDVGCVLQGGLKRTEFDCGRLDAPQARTRLCKGAYKFPPAAAYLNKHDVDLSYVRCLKVLMEGEGTPLVATHDPTMIEIAQELASRTGRGLKDFEFQMLYGIRPLEQERLANQGHRVRVYVPFGPDWYGYFVRRLAERPANMTFFLRSFLGRA